VTVAVVSWNTRQLLERSLDSLRDVAERGVAEVWVVDNASTDGSADLVRERFSWVTLIASHENLGFGAAVNAVAARTTSPWIAPANADIRLTPGALECLMSEGDRHPGVGALAPQLILPDGSTQHSVFPFPTPLFTLAYAVGALGRSDRLARHWCIGTGFDPSRARDVPWAVGAFLLVRRVAWDAAGGFDERQWMYAEDLDLGWRLRRAGWKTRYVPEARIHHDESASTTKAWGNARHERWHASTYAWLARRRGLPVTRLVATINVGGQLARWAAAVTRGTSRQSYLESARAHSIGLRDRGLLERLR
jgi:N-acetylglucosaminyl-diphospho-decaprenol L-rhamnosyltransferase